MIDAPYAEPRSAAFRRRIRFKRWRQKRAIDEYRQWLTVKGRGTADGYKDDPHRGQSLLEYVEDQTRKHGKDGVLERVKAALRERWHLPDYVDLRILSPLPKR